MIRAVDLFGRSALRSKEQKMLKAANDTARKIYSKRDKPPYNRDLEKATLEQCEKVVIEAFQKRKNFNELSLGIN